MTAAQAGNLSPFDQLVEPHRGNLLRAAQRVLPLGEDAEDIVQDSLFRAFLRLGTFRGDASFLTWLTTIVTNSALSVLRKRGRRLVVSIDELRNDPEDRPLLELWDTRLTPEQHYAQQELRDTLRLHLMRLKPVYRKIIQLHYLEGESYKDIATLQGIAVQIVRGQRYWARQELRRRMARRGKLKALAYPSFTVWTTSRQRYLEAPASSKGIDRQNTKEIKVDSSKQVLRSTRRTPRTHEFRFGQDCNTGTKDRRGDCLLFESDTTNTRIIPEHELCLKIKESALSK